MAYHYSAYTLDKKVVQGTIDAASERLAEEALYRAGYHRVLKLRETGASLSWKQWLLPSFFGVKDRDVIDFSRQLAILIEAGSPIMTAMRLLEEQAPSAAMRKVIAGLGREIQAGNSFSQALAKYPKVFSHTYCQVIKASELAGNFEVSMRRVADYLDKETASLKKVKRALIYPSVVLVLAFGVSILLTTVVLPALSKLFTELGGELPWTTRAVTAMGAFFLNDKFYLLGALAAVAALVYGYTRLPAGKKMMDTLALKAPVFGQITLQRSMYRFCQTAAMLLKTGIPLTQIVNTVAGTITNSLVRQAFWDVRDNLVQGQGLSPSMAKNPIFPQLLVEMVVVGETSGTLDSTLASMAALYEQRVEQKLQALTAMIEPTLITIVGLVVAFIAVSMIMPLYSILQTL